jgi:uncharacterized protein (TIGR00255 family)
MTGFGRGEVASATHLITVEISTVNRKQFDASIWVPREWMSFEPRIIARLKTQISRGAVKCVVTLRPISENDAMQALVDKFNRIQATAQALNLTGVATLSDLVQLSTHDCDMPPPQPTDELWEQLAKAIDIALTHLQEMRCHEGEQIAIDIRQRLTALYDLYQPIKSLAPTLPALHRDVLKKRIEELLSSPRVLDEGTLEREVAIFAERCDIAEELTRLEAHFAHAEALLSGDGPCGRPLDFLCQEFFREINTTGSKCNNREISHQVIAFKTLLETIREQVQNLE